MYIIYTSKGSIRRKLLKIGKNIKQFPRASRSPVQKAVDELLRLEESQKSNSSGGHAFLNRVLEEQKLSHKGRKEGPHSKWHVIRLPNIPQSSRGGQHYV